MVQLQTIQLCCYFVLIKGIQIFFDSSAEFLGLKIRKGLLPHPFHFVIFPDKVIGMHLHYNRLFILISQVRCEHYFFLFACFSFRLSPRLNIDNRITKIGINDRYYVQSTGLKITHCQSKMAAKNPRWPPRNSVF